MSAGAPPPALLALLIRGQAALEQGAFDAAQAAFQEAWAALPNDPGVAQLLANTHRLAGDTLASRAVLCTALDRGGWEAPEAAHALGTALLEAGCPVEAVRCFTHVVRARPADPGALGALAAALRASGDAEGAWPVIQRALKLAPRLPALLLTAAQVRHAMGDLSGAQRWLDQCERLRPGHAPTRVQRAYTTLLAGTSAAGWAAYESRPLPDPGTGARPWHGEPLAGASILVTAEQGVGDQFQLARFLPQLRERGPARLLVECHADAVSLFQASGYEAVARGAPPATDWHVPLLSLPHRLGTGADVRAEAIPYLCAPESGEPPPLPPGAPGRWRLGVVWAGNPSFVGGVTRDLPPARLADLAAIPGVEWVVLQHGPAREAAPPGWHQPRLPRSWEETAQWLQALDGLVTTDTGIAHLAGALGVRTWVLLQHVPDWRWGLQGDRTPWYPSLRLIRQPRAGDWPAVTRMLVLALERERAGVGQPGG